MGMKNNGWKILMREDKIPKAQTLDSELLPDNCFSKGSNRCD
jgi:hypothetical protein